MPVALATLPFAAVLGTFPGISPSAIVASFQSSPRLVAALRFTLVQSFASCMVALAIGLPGAWLYARFRFRGRTLLMSLASVPFCVPPVLVILAFVLYFGRAGILNAAIVRILDLDEPPLTFLYSFGGIVLVHAFYNFPIVVQIVGGTWVRLPRSREWAARTLGAGRARAFVTGTLPSLAPAIGQSASLVFLFCYFSFTVVLVFGSMAGQTLEVEVYRKARLEGDPGGAATVAFVQTMIALLVAGGFRFFEGRTNAGTRNAGGRPDLPRPKGGVAIALVGYGTFLALFFLGPIVALLVQSFTIPGGWNRVAGFGPDNFLRLLGPPRHTLFASLAQTMATAVPAAVIATTLGTVVAYSASGTAARSTGEPRSVHGRLSGITRFLTETAGTMPLAVSGVVSALGWIILFPGGGILPVILAQSSGALPFVARSLSGALASLDHGPRLAARTLGATPFAVLLTVDLPAIRPTLAASAAFAFAMAAGDVNAPLLLGSSDFQPLPLLLYRLVGAYRFSEACAVGVVLAALTGFVFFIKERTGDAI